MSKLFHKSRFAVITSAAIISAVAAGVTLFASPQQATAAAACSFVTDQDTNIIFSGLSGTDANSMRASLQTFFKNNNDGHCHTDIDTVLGLGLLQTSQLNDTAGWQLGRSHINGTLTDQSGHVVATINAITSRCFPGMTNCRRNGAPDVNHLSYTPVPGTQAVFLHAPSVQFGNSAEPDNILTLIHVNAKTGMVDFAIWVHCGNVLIITPVAPKKTLACTSLSQNLDSQNDTSFNFSFVATATAANMNSDTITFVINFGDNSQTVTKSGVGVLTQTFTHTFTQTSVDQSFVTKVTVNGVTADTCQKTIKIPAKPPLKTLACVSLVGTPAGDNMTFTFVATAQASNTTVPNSFTFDFGDNSQPVVVTGTVNGQTSSATASHAYSNAGTFTASFSAKNTEGAVTPDSASCKTPVKPVTPQMPKTGPGDTLGIVAATSAAGAALHQFRLRRKLR